MACSDDLTLKVLDEPAMLGLSLLVAPERPSIDIVFIHGFNGHPERTWRHKGDAGNPRDLGEDRGDERPRKFQKILDSTKISRDRKSVYWPKDLLPHTAPHARILAYGYDTRFGHRVSPPRSQKSVYDFAKDFLMELEAVRRCQPTRPLLFIAHSLGGVVVKEMLRQSYGYLNHHPHLRTISESTLGIVFFGTPHGGADPRGLLRSIAENVARALGFTANETVLESLLPCSERLKQLRDEFGPMARAEGWKIHCFQEDHGIKALNGRKVVEDASSCLSDSSLEITEHIANDHMDMCRFSGLHDAEYRKVAAAISRILENSSDRPSPASQTTLSIGQRQAYIKSLGFDQIDARHATIKTAHAKTCRWLLKKSGYRDWLALKRLSEHNGFLWIKGKAGTGKSTIMKYIFANAKKTMSEATVISFFFNARGGDLEKSTEGMYRSLLLQLLESRPELGKILDPLSRPLLSETGEFEIQWQLETLKDAFQAAIRCIGTKSLVCFVDALDECHEDDIRDMVAFFETLSQEAVQSGTQLHICFSSRHYPYVTVDKCVELVLEDQEGHQDDLEHYVRTELKIGESPRSEKIKKNVLQRANGIFLWVVLVVRILQKEVDRGRIHTLEKRLWEIPDGLDKLFEDILTRDGRNSDDLLLCLQWILFAKRPLRREELYFAILAGNDPDQLTPWDPTETTTDVMDRFILDCSKGLAELTKTKNQTVQFIHESVRDYLLKGDGLMHLRQPLQSDFEGQSHEKLKLCCQNYLKLRHPSHGHLRRQDRADSRLKDDGMSDNETRLATPFNDDHPEPRAAPSTSSPPSMEARSLREDLCAQYPFLSYAVNHIFDHAEAAAEKKVSQTTFTMEFDFVTWTRCNNILEKYHIRQYTPSVSPLYIFAEKNLPRLIRIQLQQVPSMDIRGERHQFPLRAAIAARNKEAVEEFLKSAIEIRSAAQPNLDSIHTQTNSRRLDCAEFLVQNSKVFNLGEESILFWAVAKGRMDLVETLLATEKVQLDCQTKIKNGCRLEISLGTSAFHLTSIRVSLYTNQREPLDSTQVALASRLLQVHVIPWAFEHGYGLLIRHLIWHLICTTGRSTEVNPLCHDADLIALISQHTWVNLNFRDARFRSLLSYAAGYGLSGLVKHMIEHRINRLDDKDDAGCTPLYYAVMNCQVDTVQMLLQTTNMADLGPPGVDLNLSPEHKEVIELMLEHGVNHHGVTVDYHRPLNWACLYGHESMVKLLLGRGDVRVNATNDDGDTPLHAAVTKGREAIVKLLLEHGDIDVNATNKFGETPLVSALIGRREAVARLLLERSDIKVDPVGTGSTPINEYARMLGNTEVAQMLEEKMCQQQGGSGFDQGGVPSGRG
ncbi:uncharacterized protein Z519_04818 [Cladophialophora bantiana CBS 173.52]|uniref:Nephrocystin 3-like N-terminal domain-containing protein n=1 Tax=Cladophialophora bantiana (strain ATCC 10958 / CBS 173.52 / CDC B-1940 / NIH 8579) TaxID=1442370 RepID=A0A0D2HVE3_CLAB1|nr:uncharacterized protein Z519_04818 [Cladophialophora bantiana CBS 173.52]KIW94840.1 hypothetical protein Z519_04818 [Cladophialophora bantiana CBS 173.52]